MNNLEVLLCPSWVYNSSCSRGLNCSELMNHHWVSSYLPSTGSGADFNLSPLVPQQKSSHRSACTQPASQRWKKSSYNLLAASVYFTARLRLSLIFFHHLLYSFKSCFIILNSRLTGNKQDWTFLFLRGSPCFHILASCHNISKDGVQKKNQNQISAVFGTFNLIFSH